MEQSCRLTASDGHPRSQARRETRRAAAPRPVAPLPARSRRPEERSALPAALDSYLDAIGQIPLLTAADERALAQQVAA